MLKKELLELCLLHLLAQQDRYGYEMLSRIYGAFPEIHESAVYAVLRSLKGAGFAETYQGQTSAGPARKYYRITPQGRQRFQTMLDQWRRLVEGIREIGVE